MLRYLPFFLLASTAFGQVTVSLDAVADTTLYETAPGAAGISNGSGEHLFAGRNSQGNLRRALLRFDVEGSVPTGATIQAVELQLNLSQTQSTVADVALHRLTADWGEGASDAPGSEGMGTAAVAGDATWEERFVPGQAWSSAGGDFVTSPSASASVGGVGVYVWPTTPGLVLDVQSMLEAPNGDFGWILLGDEPTAGNPKRFDSRHITDPTLRPRLRVTYTADDCPVSVASNQLIRPGLPANPSAFLPGPTNPILGAVWNPVVDHTTFLPTAFVDVLVVGQQPANVPSALGTILIDLAAPTTTFTVPAGDPFALQIPSSCAFLGLIRQTQVVSADLAGVLQLTNGIEVQLGDV